MSILENVQESLGPSEISQIADQLGIDPQSAERAVAAAVPMVVGGMAGHATQSPEAASDLHEAMQTHAAAMDDVSESVQAPPPPSGFLNRIFGSHQETVQQGIQHASGLALDKVKQLVSMVSPIVLSALARHKNAPSSGDQTAPQQVSNLLQQEAQTAQQQAPHLSGTLGKLLSAF
jgi:hypothetical protein